MVVVKGNCIVTKPSKVYGRRRVKRELIYKGNMGKTHKMIKMLVDP